jgi:hypothetical protein
MPVQNYYLSHKSQHNSKATASDKTEVFGMKPSQEVVRNLMAYAAALVIMKTRSLGNLPLILN